MKGDFSRFSFDPKRNVRTVTVQQGRVLTDADMNEASEATLRRVETETVDTLGPEAAPLASGGFQILPPGGGKPVRLSAGRFYVDGLQLENHAETALPAFAGNGRRLIYVRATVDHITGVEAGVLRDAALGDADTAGRAIIRTETGVIDAGTNDTCASPNTLFDALRAASGGLMTVALTPTPASSDPCRLTPDGGYARLENLLYRCEVHNGPLANGIPGRFTLNGLEIKLSRNNASELAAISQVSGNRITLAAASRDGLPVFRRGEYAELLPAAAPFDAAASGPMSRIDDVDGDVIVLTNPAGATAGGRVRLWSQAIITLDASQTISADGLDFTFSGNNFRKGDYWVVPGRYIIGDVDATVAKNVPLPPAGPRIVFAKLGLLTVTGGAVDPASIIDCRPLYVPLTQSVELDTAGGDGQSIRPPTAPGAAPLTDPLPSPLRAVVRIGHRPVAGARVVFSIVLPSAAGSLSGIGAGGVAVSGLQIEAISGADGVAEATWKLSASPVSPVQRVTARLLTDANPGQIPPPPLQYTATLDLASGVGYQPGACTALQQQTTVQGALDKLCADIASLTAEQIAYQPGACASLLETKTVQEALDKLCADLIAIRKEDFLVVTHVTLATGRELDNNEFCRPEEFIRGFTVRFSDKLEPKSMDGFEPIARLTIELPFPTGSEQNEWADIMGGNRLIFATRPIFMSGIIKITENEMEWSPTPATQQFFATAGSHRFGLWRRDARFEEPYVRGAITLRGDSIWSAGERRRYLNGEIMRFVKDNNPFSIFPEDGGDLKKRIALIKALADPQRAADFDLWFKFEV